MGSGRAEQDGAGNGDLLLNWLLYFEECHSTPLPPYLAWVLSVHEEDELA